MEQSKTMQNVMMRARGEAMLMHAEGIQIEHIYLAILKVSQLSSEKIAPSSAERAAIDEEIRALKTALERAGVDAAETAEALRRILKDASPLSKAAADRAVEELLTAAPAPSERRLTAVAALRAIFANPTPLIAQVNGRPISAPAEGSLFDEETAYGEYAEPLPAAGGADAPAPSAGENTARASAAPGEGSLGHSNSNDADGAGGRGFVMPAFPKPGEMNLPNMTLFDLSEELDDEDEADEIRDVGDKADDRAGSDGESIPDESDEDERVGGEAEEPPKRRGGVDLFSIMAELREKREGRGGGSFGNAEEDEGDDARPAAAVSLGGTSGGSSEPSDDSSDDSGGVDLFGIMEEMRRKREGKGGEPASAEEPARTGADDSSDDSGVDLFGIMEELREKRERDKGQGSSSDDEESALLSAWARESDDLPRGGARPKRERRAKGEKRRTALNGIKFRGGLAAAAVQYALLVVAVTGAALWLLGRASVSPGLSPSVAAYLLYLAPSVFCAGAYYFLKLFTGLVMLRRAAFAHFLNAMLYAAAMWLLAELLIEYTGVRVTGSVTWLKIIAALVGISNLLIARGTIHREPNRFGIEKSAQFGFFSLSGSPDKIFFSALLLACLLPFTGAAIYWIVGAPFNKAFSIYLFLNGWFFLLFWPNCQMLWYPEDDAACSRAQRKKKAACQNWILQFVLLFVPAIVAFLTLLYGWTPIPKWTIVVYVLSGIFYLIGTIASVTGNRVD